MQDKILKIIIICLLFISPCFADVSGGLKMWLEEEDGSPSIIVYKTKVTNGSLTDNSDGTGSLVTGAGGGSGAPTDATYITQTTNATLSAEQALGALSTGIMKVTTTTGVVSSITDNSSTWDASVDSVTGTSPISSSGGQTPAISIADAAADGSTKGAASFTAADFNATSGNISLDYTNGQAASGTLKGFLASADWTTFNNKEPAITAGTTAQFYRGDKAFSDTLVGTLTADGFTLGNDENFTLGAETFKFSSSTNDFEFSDDITISDTDPHLQLKPASGNAFELYAYNSELYLTNVTTGNIIAKVTQNDTFVSRGERVSTFAIENLAAADDNYEVFMAERPVTITKIGVHCRGTCTTKATIALEDRAGNAMTHSAPTVSTGTGNTTFTAVTANNTLATGEGLAFDVTNAVSPETDEYIISIVYYVNDVTAK